MSKRKFEKPGKEKWIMFLSSVLVIGACTVTGVYMNEMSQLKDEGYVVDLSQLDEQTGLEQGMDLNQEAAAGQEAAGWEAAAGGETEQDLQIPQNVNSDSVLNQADIGEAEAKAEGIQEPVLDLAQEGALESVQKEATEPIKSMALEPVAEALHFGETDTMMWPISGNVILNYSMDKTVYFSTLDQYKYNPAIYISADVGTPVNAAARGSVTEVGSNEEIGQFICMDLGDGYEVTYGELEQINVTTGDLVAKGQVIASLATPTKYYSLEGANLYFKVEKDASSVNPMNYLQ